MVLRVQPQLRAPGCIHVILEAVSPRPPFILENLTSTACLYRYVVRTSKHACHCHPAGHRLQLLPHAQALGQWLAPAEAISHDCLVCSQSRCAAGKLGLQSCLAWSCRHGPQPALPGT